MQVEKCNNARLSIERERERAYINGQMCPFSFFSEMNENSASSIKMLKSGEFTYALLTDAFSFRRDTTWTVN